MRGEWYAATAAGAPGASGGGRDAQDPQVFVVTVAQSSPQNRRITGPPIDCETYGSVSFRNSREQGIAGCTCE